jgi:hypothetical protein
MSKREKLGIIQSRGLGDIVISLPIAKWYYDQGHDIYWPICDQFYSSMAPVVPWVNWVRIPTDPQGLFFYDVPRERLRNLKVKEHICLYQALTGHPEFSAEKYFQHTKFDQYKYIKAQVPFLEKWKLAECISRNAEREQMLYDRLVQNENYVVYHLQGSDHRADFDRSIIPQGWQAIEIVEQTDCIWDWLKILEGAQSLIMVDSVFSNIVDQMNIGDDRYFIARSHIGLTPVYAQNWTWI